MLYRVIQCGGVKFVYRFIQNGVITCFIAVTARSLLRRLSSPDYLVKRSLSLSAGLVVKLTNEDDQQDFGLRFCGVWFGVCGLYVLLLWGWVLLRLTRTTSDTNVVV